MMRLSRLLALGTGILLVSAEEAAAVMLWATGSNTDGLSMINSDTGEHRFLGRFDPDPSRFTVPIELSTRPSDGAIFIVNNSFDTRPDQGLAIVDPVTALATHLFRGPFGVIAFDTNDVLYTHMIGSRTTDTGPIATVNLETGTITSLGGPSLPRLTGLAFNPVDNLLYGATQFSFSTGQSLLTIDPHTGQVLASVAVHSAGGSGIDDLVFDSSGNAIVCASGAIRDFDITTGKASNYRAFSPTALFQGVGLVIPEVSSSMLMVTGACFLMLGRRRQS